MVNHFSLNGQFSSFVMTGHFDDKFTNKFWIYQSHLQLCLTLLLNLDSNLFNSLLLTFIFTALSISLYRQLC